MVDPRTIEGSPERAADRGRDFMFDGSVPVNGLPSLGDPEVVDALVRGFLGRVADLRKQYNEGNLHGTAVTAAIVDDANDMQGIVYGASDEYAAGPLNAPQKLDPIIAARWGFEYDGTLLARHMFVSAANQLVDAMIEHEEGKISDDIAQYRVDGLVSDLAETLLGLPIEPE